MMVADIFSERRTNTERIIEKLKASLLQQLGPDLDSVIGQHTCVYATGSCGRMEMGAASDLDAYVVRTDGAAPSNDARIRAAVEKANEELRLPDLDGSGKYLEMVNSAEILDLLGEPKDDESGVLTKRMLLLLESRVLLGEDAHKTLVRGVIDAYWKNDNLHPTDYQPIVLVNDIVRYWRIVLLNHEWKLREKAKKLDPSDANTEPLLLAERRYRSYKLRLPRCLTCFSALTYLLALTPRDPSHVSKEQIGTMVSLTPIERLQALETLTGTPLPVVERLLETYARYLERTDEGKEPLLKDLLTNERVQKQVSGDGRSFTKDMFELVQQLGGGRTLHRHMLV